MPTWNPRQGASGEDVFRWGTANLINAGGTDYSSPPTLSQVNAGSGLNQIVAEIKRQGGGSGLGYTSTSTLPSVSWLNSLKTAIDAVRSADGRCAFPWTVWPISTAALLSDLHLRELREALAEVLAEAAFTIEGVNSTLTTSDPPYPPTAQKTCVAGSGAELANGWYWISRPNWPPLNISRVARAYLNFTVPGLAGSTAKLRLYLRRDWVSPNCNFSDYDVNLYSLDTAIAVPTTNAETNAAWSASMTLQDAIAVATLCPSRNTYYEREFTLSGLTGGPLTLCLANSGEITQTRPNRNNGVPSWLEYVEDKHAQAMQVYNGTYAKLVF